jgi:excisionase family DNA binding protein
MEMLTVEEVARQLHCGHNTVFKLIKQGELPSFRVGRLRMVLRQDVEALIERRLKAEAQSAIPPVRTGGLSTFSREVSMQGMLTIDETARQLGCGRWGVYEFIRTGELPSVKIGRRRVVRWADVDALLVRRAQAEGQNGRH